MGIKVGVVGTGHLGSLHAGLYQQVEGAELAGVYDIDLSRAEEVARATGSRAYRDLPGLLAAVDAVNVVVPTTHHFEIAEQALRAGKHVFIEKPITSRPEQAAQLIALARANHCLIQVGHIERFNQAMRAVQRLQVNPMFIESHRLASFNPRGTDVAVVLDLMIHDLDVILTLVKSPIRRIDANGVAVISDEPDIANARLTFENGCVANVTASRISQKKMRKMRLFERDTYISIDFLQGVSERFSLESAVPHDRDVAPLIMGTLEGKRKKFICYEKLEAPEGNALALELSAFVGAIREKKPAPVPAEEGMRALAVAIQISEIIKQQHLSDQT